MVHGTQSGRAKRGSGRIQARAVFTVLGIAALLIGAVLNWETGLAGNKLTLRSLIENDFHTRSDVLRTVAAASTLIAIVALLGLLDRTGWLTRLAGLAAVVLFVLFAVQVFRHYNENFSTSYHALRAGVWFQLGAGVVLLIGGFIRYRRRRVPVAPTAEIASEVPEQTKPVEPKEQTRRIDPVTEETTEELPEETGQDENEKELLDADK